MQFTRIRLSGFKSFIDRTEVPIEPGLTGIVGPNGCGKSNLVESLKWVMAETSAKAMRGAEMDDVIFGGTANRPTRNIAEVALLLDNSERRAPAVFNDSDQLEVSRRIERGRGSAYRVNGREVRARDVQVLFADAATGARSTAIVTQGQIGALVNARPADRRALLEEAAGITGIHSRRHEAELRLRAAENNLERLDDVIVTLEGQLQGLKRQARQASRYRNLSDHIRRAESLYLHLRWRQASEQVEGAETRLAAAAARLVELTGLAGMAATHQAEAAAGLPELRRAEAEAAAELHRLAVARDGLDAEEARVASARSEHETRLSQIDSDLAREQARAADAAAATARLAEERQTLDRAQADEQGARAEARARLEAAEAEAGELEAAVTGLTERLAAEDARRDGLERQCSEARERLGRLVELRDRTAAERHSVAAETVTADELQAAEAALEAARAEREAARAGVAAAEDARARALAQEAAVRDEYRQAEAVQTRLRAEESALTALLATAESDMWAPLVDQVTVTPGYEAALGVALGDDLTAPADEGAPVHWRTLPPYARPAPLPAGAAPLDHYVEAPAPLRRRLSQIGVVRDRDQGDALCAALGQGQRLVSTDGAMWRWDGYTIAPGAKTAAEVRLAQRNRLAEVRSQAGAADGAAEAARARLDACGAATAAAVAAEKSAQGTVEAALTALEAAHERHAALARRSAAADSRLAGLDESLARLATDLTEAEESLRTAEAGRAALADGAAARQRLVGDRARLAERRAELGLLQGEVGRLDRESEARRARLDAIGAETESWHDRAADAARQAEQLTARRGEVMADLDRLAARPAEIAGQRHALLDRIAGSEKRRNQAADRLAQAEARLAALDRAVKEAEAALGDARETRVRGEAAVEQAEALREELRQRIAERIGCEAEALAAAAGLKEGEALPGIETVETRLERLNRERENMGPVNLRAEQEAAELREQIDTLEAERTDLLAAIARLRHGISELNREGRERLLASFDTVNAHFQNLFVRLFGGGKAYLKLTDADDPLDAGLEIMASPPGKRLQVLSLLSGGERALTALSLLFAVFLTNPAPVCVLDEVDAPLDDANVDRFCRLLDEIAQRSATRFLLVTHHHMTMARMDRLFGVTMSEPGVSQLVSVDLRGAAQLQAAE